MKYKKTRVGLKTEYTHRYVWKQTFGAIPQGMQIHHINGNKNDNRIENLKLVTAQENMTMSDKWGKGYRLHKRLKFRKYEASRRCNGIQQTFGYFGTPCGAYMASMMAYVS